MWSPRACVSFVRVGMLGRGVPPPPRSAHAASDAAAVGQSPRHHATPGLRAGLEGLERDLRRDGHIRHHRQREPALVPLLAPVRLGPHVCRGPASARDGPPCPDQSWGTSALTTHQVQAFPILAPDPCPPVRPSRLPAARSARPAQRSTVRPLTTPRRSPAARPTLPAPAAPRPDPRTSAARAHLPPPPRQPACPLAGVPPELAHRVSPGGHPDDVVLSIKEFMGSRDLCQDVATVLPAGPAPALLTDSPGAAPNVLAGRGAGDSSGAGANRCQRAGG